jgi:hypothetical protein
VRLFEQAPLLLPPAFAVVVVVKIPVNILVPLRVLAPMIFH